MSGDASIAVTDLDGDGPTLILLHGLAGSSREMLPTAAALRDEFRVLLMDQRGHGSSTRRPGDLSRDAYVRDVIEVIESARPGEPSILVGQSMGAHTSVPLLSTPGHLVRTHLVMLDGHVAGGEDSGEAGRYFASWPVPFADERAARAFLGSDAIVDAWIADFEVSHDGLRPRFDADVMQRIIEAVHEPRWDEWEALQVSTLAIFARRMGCSPMRTRAS